MTNYEKVMNEMTPELLGKILDAVGAPCVMCAYRNTDRCAFHCLDGIETWLKQEAEDEAD